MAQIGRTRYKPEPIKSKNYDALSRRIEELQAQRETLYEDLNLTDDQLFDLEKPINKEILSLIDKLYL